MSDTYLKNIDLLLKKYPRYTFFIPSIELCKKNILNNKSEKAVSLVNSLVDINNTEVIYIYGLGSAACYLDLKSWLEEDKLRNLVFIEDDEKPFSAFLYNNLSSEILNDPSVHIYYKLKEEDEDCFLDSAISNFFYGKIKVLPSPTLTDKQRKNFNLIKEKILRLATYYTASHIDDMYSYLNFSHFYKNMEKIPLSFYVNKLKNKFKGIPAIICGAGPSLYKERNELKKNKDKALIIAGGSAITALISYGIKPHFGVVIDPNIDEVNRMEKAKVIDFPILYSTRVHSSVFKHFTGPLGYISSIGGGIESLYLEDRLNIKSDYIIGQNLTREALSVTTINLELAHFLGCNPIILSGVDLSYYNNKRYSDGIVDKDNKIIIKDDDPGDFLIEDKNIITSVKWKMEERAISTYAKKYDLTVFNTSKTGVKFNGIEYMPLNKLIKESIKNININEIIDECLKKTVNVSKKDINIFQQEIKKSLMTSKDLISKIKNEIENLITTKSNKTKTPLSIVYQRDLKEEIAYKYFLVRPKIALNRWMDNYYKPHFSDLSNDQKLNKIFDLWDNLLQITCKYIDLIS